MFGKESERYSFLCGFIPLILHEVYNHDEVYVNKYKSVYLLCMKAFAYNQTVMQSHMYM